MPWQPSAGLLGDQANQERDACGVGFVASRTGTRSHADLREAITALGCMEHRGACGADQITGDGTGVMTDIPFELLGPKRGEVAVATTGRDDLNGGGDSRTLWGHSRHGVRVRMCLMGGRVLFVVRF